jgi:hypothetical protein
MSLLRVALALVAILAARAGAADLMAVSVSGPVLATAGETILAEREIASLDAGVQGAFTYEYRLSGTVVATRSSDQLGAFKDSITLPHGTLPGLHVWELLVLPLPGETNLDDNFVTGGAIIVLPAPATPCLVGPATVDLYSVIGATADPPQLAVEIAHCDTTTLPLSWIATVTPPAPWLTISSLAGVVFPGQSSSVTLSFAALALPQTPASYSATVRFASVSDPSLVAELEVRLEIGDPRFEPGDVLTGTFDSPDEVDSCFTAAIAGMDLVVKQPTNANAANLAIELLGPDGKKVGSKKFQAGKKGKVTFDLEDAGKYQLIVRGDQAGEWTLSTARKLPKKAKGFVKKFDAKPPGAISAAPIGFSALEGATLFARFTPSIYIGGIYQARLWTPEGGAIDLPLDYQPLSAELVVGPLPLSVTGGYGIEFTAALPKPQKVTLDLDLAQPSAGGAVVVIP